MNIGLLLTFVVGFFTMIGTFIVFKAKNNQKIIDFSICIAFSVMLSLAILEIIPEEIELFKIHFKGFKIFGLIFGSTLIGIGLLKTLDHFIPDHEMHGHSKKAHNENLMHIGTLSSIALILHNIIEGMALYTSATTDTKIGLLMGVGIGLHNIPLGMIITSTFYNGNKNKKRTIFYLIGISLSTFIGGLLSLLLHGFVVSENVMGILLGITLGMLIYISFSELLPKIKEMKDKKMIFWGNLIGVVILLISLSF